MTITIGLHPGLTPNAKKRYILREGHSFELNIYELSDKVQRLIEASDEELGAQFDSELFAKYRKSGDIWPSPASTETLAVARQAESQIKEAPFRVETTPVTVEVGAVERVLSSRNGYARFVLGVRRPEHQYKESWEVWLKEDGNRQGVTPPRQGQLVRLYCRSHNLKKALCIARILYPVAGDNVTGRDGKKWILAKSHPNMRPGFIRLRDISSGETEVHPRHYLVSRTDQLVLVSAPQFSTAHLSWKTVSLKPPTGREIGEPWRMLDEYLNGNLEPAEVQWEQLAEQIRHLLETGRYLPRPIWRRFAKISTQDGRRLSHIWHDLRRDHLNTCWMHLREHVTLGQLAAGTDRDWDTERIHRQLCEVVEKRAREHRHETQEEGLLNYAAKLKGIEPRQFKTKSMTLQQLVELSEPAHRGSLPVEKFLARAASDIGVDIDERWPRELMWLEIHRALPAPKEQYRRFPLKKSSGKKRWIDEPCSQLASVQKRIVSILNAYRAAHPCATGFLSGRSAVLHSRYHEGARSAVCVDIRDFFPSISEAQVFEALDNGPRFWQRKDRWCNPFKNWDALSREMLSKLVTHPYDKRLPQGAPSSPAIANLVAYSLDAVICNALKQHKNSRSLKYSRYADDLVISSTNERDRKTLEALRDLMIGVIESMGWQVAPEKTRIWQAAHREPLELCGTVVPRHSGGQLGLPRNVRRRLRSATHHVEMGARMAEDAGLLSYAYAVTGEHRLRVLASDKTRALVKQLAQGLAPEDYRDFFWSGWMQT